MALFGSKKRKEQENALLATENYVFRIEDIFYHKNDIVSLGGRMIKGTVCVGDNILFNNVEYEISGIARGTEPNREMAQDLYCALLIRYKTTGIYKTIFKLGAVKIVKKTNDTNRQNSGAHFGTTIVNKFVCDVCGKELPIKYRHKGNTCVECSKAKREQNTQQSTSACKAQFCLGTFNFTEEDRQKLKAAAIRYLPPALDNAEAQLQLLKTLSLVMDVSVVELKTELSWKIPNGMPDDMKKERFTSAFIETILAVNQTLGFLNPDFLIKKVDSANSEELLKSWIVLDYYAHTLKSEYTPNIQHFRDYIHNTLQTKFLKANDESTAPPVKFDGTNIYIDSNAFLQWKKANVLTPQYEINGILPLMDKEPVIYLYEDGIKTREYVLQTENDEDFTGKYFLISVRLGVMGNPAVPVAQIDGFVSDSPEERQMTHRDIGYRMEGHFLACGGASGKQRYEMNRGQDLPMKALKYHGYTTPANVRLIGVCPDCGKSFCFHGYAFYMTQSDVAYSDDGLDCCEIQAYGINKDTWTYETEGKVFRYYNSFNCPHCGTPYIDYIKHPENKVFGVSGCVLLGKKPYQFRQS